MHLPSLLLVFTTLMLSVKAEVDISSLPQALQVCMTEYQGDFGMRRRGTFTWEYGDAEDLCAMPVERVMGLTRYMAPCVQKYCMTNECPTDAEGKAMLASCSCPISLSHMICMFNFFHVYWGHVWMRFFVELGTTLHDSYLVYWGSLFIGTIFYQAVITLVDIAMDEHHIVLCLLTLVSATRIILDLCANGLPTRRVESKMLMACLMVGTFITICSERVHSDEAKHMAVSMFPTLLNDSLVVVSFGLVKDVSLNSIVVKSATGFAFVLTLGTNHARDF
ncbi:hypothetical protein E4T39_04539 [Aureobasidium subglaciale]|nr:hypothetical protein E4T39_04539 [Aureobasidium subglaciale]